MNRCCLLAIFVLAALFAVSGGGCQTIAHGTTQVVTVNSDPMGATVEIVGGAGQPSQLTPAYFVLSRTQSQVLLIKKEGFKPQQVTLTAQVNTTRATPEIGVMSVLGSVVDVAAGGCWELVPGKVEVKLEATGTATAAVPAATTPSTPAASSTPKTVALPAPTTNPITSPIIAAPVPGPASPAPSTSAASALSAAVQYNLLRIDNLLQQGAISKEEHAALRQMVLTTGTIAGAEK